MIPIETEGRVATQNDRPKPTDQPAPEPGLEAMVAAIEQRANYISPVLDHLLHLDRETAPGTLRE